MYQNRSHTMKVQAGPEKETARKRETEGYLPRVPILMSATLVFWVCCSTATEALMTLTLCFLAQLRGKAGVLRHGEENPTRETDPPLQHLIGQECRGVRAWFIHR